MSARKHFTCTVPGCDRPHLAKGLCGAHYKRTQQSEKGLEPERAINDIAGPRNPHWKGGIHIREDGYVALRMPAHPMAGKKSGYVLRHRLLMAEIQRLSAEIQKLTKARTALEEKLTCYDIKDEEPETSQK